MEQRGIFVENLNLNIINFSSRSYREFVINHFVRRKGGIENWWLCEWFIVGETEKKQRDGGEVETQFASLWMHKKVNKNVIRLSQWVFMGGKIKLVWCI